MVPRCSLERNTKIQRVKIEEARLAIDIFKFVSYLFLRCLFVFVRCLARLDYFRLVTGTVRPTPSDNASTRRQTT